MVTVVRVYTSFNDDFVAVINGDEVDRFYKISEQTVAAIIQAAGLSVRMGKTVNRSQFVDTYGFPP